jgi:two-component system, OmpR family, sensor kinase
MRSGMLPTSRTPPTALPSADPADLSARLAQAEAALRARDDFLAAAAHELRSPLHALGLRVAALERMAAQNGQPLLHRELQRTRRSVDRYVRRAVTLLDLSRGHAGVLAPDPVHVRAADVIQAVVEDYQAEAEFHGTTLLIDADGQDVEGWWDAHMIEQILANLVSNAIKYGQGTPVRVGARIDEAGRACFEVSDEGPGIDAAHRQRIFEKFERVVARDAAGYGLGLWIVGRMVGVHRGTIEVTDRPGGGALFRVLLPAELPGAAEQDSRT